MVIFLGLLLILLLAACLGVIVCFIMMQSKMVKNGQGTLATVSTVWICVGGLGFWLAFIYGWIKAKEWGIEKFMRIWSVLVAVSIVLAVIAQVVMVVVGPAQ